MLCACSAYRWRSLCCCCCVQSQCFKLRFQSNCGTPPGSFLSTAAAWALLTYVMHTQVPLQHPPPACVRWRPLPPNHAYASGITGHSARRHACTHPVEVASHCHSSEGCGLRRALCIVSAPGQLQTACHLQGPSALCCPRGGGSGSALRVGVTGPGGTPSRPPSR